MSRITSRYGKRAHAELFVERLLSLDEGISPLNLILDSPEQSALPLLSDYVRRAQSKGDRTVFVSYETLVPPVGIDVLIRGGRTGFETVQAKIQVETQTSEGRILIIFDSSSTLLKSSENPVTALGSVAKKNTSLVIVCHTPYELKALQGYGPRPTKLLEHLATTIVTLHSISHARSHHAAVTSSRTEPVFGLDAEQEGILVGNGSNHRDGLVLELEHRRRSGRAIGFNFVLVNSKNTTERSHIVPVSGYPGLSDHAINGNARISGDISATFNMSLTEDQRNVRDAVKLPYFDAQDGTLAGGRILYDISREDDFDEEEDE